ncbi:MAG TPA: hypothetical protein VFK05_25470 [Polyangiaceae bacterium]|nr:hypothetical protein [Polyangiaceae bacterium]
MQARFFAFRRVAFSVLLSVHAAFACSSSESAPNATAGAGGSGANAGRGGAGAVAGRSGAEAIAGNAQGGAAGGASAGAAGSSTIAGGGSGGVAGSSSGGGGSAGIAGSSAGAGVPGGATGSAGAGPTMRATQAIFDQHCTNCHYASEGHPPTYPGLPLTSDAAHAALVSQPADETCGGTRVVPFDSAHSYLFRKLADDTPCSGERMPRSFEVGPASPLSAAELETIRVWIDGGAQP